MKKLTQIQFDTINANFGEFFEIAELHSSGQLIQVAYYDAELNDEEVQYYAVSTHTVIEPNDMCHVFDFITQKVQCVEKRDADDNPIVWLSKVDGPTQIFVDCVVFDTSAEAIDYAMGLLRPIAIKRDNYAT